jgi:hypothetical protein
MPRPLNVATPLEGVAVRVDPLEPTTVPDERVAVTTFDAVVTLLFPASRISTTGCVVKLVSYLAPLAFVAMESCVGAPTPTVKFAESVDPRLVVENWSL